MAFNFDERLSDSPFVEKVWYTQSDQFGKFTSMAATHWEIVVTKQHGKTTVSVRGPETKATSADFAPGGEFLGIIFKLGTFMPAYPLHKVIDRQDLHLPASARQSFYFYGSAWEVPTFENADTFVERLVRGGFLVRDEVVTAALQGYQPDLSVRTLQRRFLQATGLSHKAILQIERAREARQLLEHGVPILDVVYETGFYDQPHLTKALKHYMGQTPAQILQGDELGLG